MRNLAFYITLAVCMLVGANSALASGGIYTPIIVDGSNAYEYDYSQEMTPQNIPCSMGINGVCSIRSVSSITGNVVVTGTSYFNGFGPIFISTITQSPSTMSSAPDGWYIVTRTGYYDVSGHTPYLFFNKNNGIYTYSAFPISPQSGISLETPIAQTYLNNPVLFSGKYINTQTFDKIRFNINYDTIGQTLVIPDTDIILGNGIYNWSKNLNMPYSGNYTAKVRLFDSSTGSTTEWSSSVTFGLASTTIVNSGENISTSTIGVGVLGTEICNLTDIACHFKNVLIVLFQPTTASIQQFGDLKEKIENKPPFGYFTMLKTNMESLSASTTAKFNIVIPTYLKDSIFDPLKTGIASILWLFGLVWLYKRLTNINL